MVKSLLEENQSVWPIKTVRWNVMVNKTPQRNIQTETAKAEHYG